MAETDILLTMRPQDAILRMLNRANNTHFWPQDFDVGEPTSLGDRATKVTLVTRPVAGPADEQPVHSASVDFTFNRLNLATHFAGALNGFTVSLPSSTQVVLDELTRRMGQAFFLEDVILEEITRDNAKSYLLKAKAESKRWVGALEVQLITLIDLPSLIAGGLPTTIPQLGTLTQPAALFAPEVSVPHINATPYRDLIATFKYGDMAQDHPALVDLINNTVPPPGHRIEENLRPWAIKDTKSDYNLRNATVNGVVSIAPLSINKINAALDKALVIHLDATLVANFTGAPLSVILPFYSGTYDDSAFNLAPRLTQVGVVSMTDASLYALLLNPLKVGDVLTQTQLPGPMELEPGIIWSVNPTTPGPTNLANAVVQYNGQKRNQDITPAHQGLDRVLIISFSELNTAYRGNMTIFYTSPIQLPLTIPNGTVGSAYSYQLVTNGGKGPYTYQITSGSLAPGMALDSATGWLSGTPTTNGAFQFAITVTDSTGLTVPFVYTYSVGTQIQPLQLTGTVPTTGKLGTAYTGFVNINGGKAPYANPRQVSGNLPDSIALSIVGSSLRLAGNWQAAGSYAFTLAVDSADGQTAQTTQQVVVSDGLVLSGAPLPTAVGETYQYDYQITGGQQPYSNPRTVAGTFPDELSLSVVGNALRISGTPQTDGVYSFTVAVNSADGQTATRASVLVVNKVNAPRA